VTRTGDSKFFYLAKEETKMKSRVFILGFITLPLAGLMLGIFLGGLSIWREEELIPVVGNVKTFEAAYARWRQSAEQNDQKTKLVMSLGYFNGLSSEFSSAHGTATLDLTNGAFTAQVSGLAENQTFDLWLVQNRPGAGRSVKPEPGDGMIRLGTLTHEKGYSLLQTALDRKILADFKIDLVVVAPSSGNPWKNGLLFATPNIFQKLYYSEEKNPNLVPTKLAEPGDGESRLPLALLTPFRSLIPTLAHADKGGFPNHADLIARGEKLFFEEKFQGNGRTCGTCHPAENNFTVDPAFIATLPKTDPLFVAEFDKNLMCDDPVNSTGCKFENPVLMRQHGLILENVDGTDNLATKFVMRGTPHTLAQSLSITPAPFFFDGTSPTVLNRTGWGGDGAPGTGTLREFATGAVTQHFTRTLNRIAGVDFRLPTDAELDAIEAFMLSLGRQVELDLASIILSDPDANTGRTIFNDPGPNGGKCFFCHFNAGANHGINLPFLGAFPGVQNANFNTGVENEPHPAGRHGPSRPRDGGFGREGNLTDGFGIASFSTPPLVEAADKRAFFHNNLCDTIECAVDFYNSLSFNSSPAAAFASINLGQSEVFAVAAFLRAINALENIRSAIEKLENVQSLSNSQALRLPQLQRIFRLASVDIRDAYRVLEEGRDPQFKPGGLYPTARSYLEYAMENCDMARSLRSRAERNYRITEALNALVEARDDILAP
jgi:hypothetical protein